MNYLILIIVFKYKINISNKIFYIIKASKILKIYYRNSNLQLKICRNENIIKITKNYTFIIYKYKNRVIK